MSKNVLIIGAGGFVGGFIADEALRRGYTVTAGIRESTSRRYLADSRIRFLILDYENPEQMAEAIAGAVPEGDAYRLVYNLGATKCTNFADFNRINYQYLRNVVEALRMARRIPGRLLYMSSLSALGPGDERTYAPLTGKTIPAPDTRYGVSKIKAETFLETCPDIPWTIFRPTGVYGPHEQDYLMMICSIDRHWDFGVGLRRQMLTFIYVKDLAAAVFDALDTDRTLRRKYIISEPRSYTQAEFRRIAARILRRRLVIPVRVPIWMLYVVSAVAEKIGVIRSKPSTLNRDKFRIMRQRNWNCSVDEAVADFGFAPRYDLVAGLTETVAAYRESLGEEASR